MMFRAPTTPRTYSVLTWIGLGCIVYLMVRPVSHNSVLVPVLALLGVASAGMIVIRRTRPEKSMLQVLLAVIGVGLFGVAIGLRNPGVSAGALVWIVAPILFGLWLLAGTEHTLRIVLLASAIATIVVGCLLFIYIAGELRIAPQALPPFVQAQGGLGFDHTLRGATAIRFYGLSTYVASAPLWLTAAFLPAHPVLPRKMLSIAAAVCALLVAAVSGRTALLIVSIAVPVLLWLVWRILTRRSRRTRWQTWRPLAAVAVVAAAVLLLMLTGNQIVQRAGARLTSTFTGQQQSADDLLRAQEAPELLHAWAKSPIIGHGWGAVIPGYSRSNDRPWNFELQYHEILFQVGILGALALIAACVVAIIAFVRAVRRRPDMLTVLLVTVAGAVALLIANASNPYLQAPGNMWPIYLALMAVNVALSSPTVIVPPAGSPNSAPPSRTRGPVASVAEYGPSNGRDLESETSGSDGGEERRTPLRG